MSAQEAVKRGAKRRIGDGSNTKVWNVQWLPDLEIGCLTTPMPDYLKDITVQSFMELEGHKWDMDIICDICNERDMELIKRIPVPMSRREDSWFWILEDKEQFTVRSCYKWLQGECNTVNSSFWKRLWSLKMPGKVINFIWRVCQGVLPTVSALAVKQVNVDVKYPWCHSCPEKDIHVLFKCDFARTVWLSTGLHHLLQVTMNDTAAMVLEKTFEKCTRDQCVLIGMTLWSLWNRRNKWVWEKVNGSAFGVWASAMNLLNDWQEAQKNERQSANQVEAGSRIWTKPPLGWVKMNVDAVVFQDGSIGIGSVIRDSNGQFLRARCRKMDGAWQPREAETIGLKEAMSWAKELNINHCIVEIDSKALADSCNGKPGEAYFGTIVLDCV